MNEIQLACKLDQIVQSGPNIFIKLNPEIVDFTLISPSFNLIFLTKDSEFNIEINDENFMEVLSLVKTALFENQSLFIIGWNLKNLFTYILSKTNDHLEFTSKLLDLKLAEGFIGIRERAPSKFADVVKRLKIVLADSSWTKFKNVYQRIYQPLMMTVMPKIEIEGVFDKEKRQILFPYYEIEGQLGGRLACQLAYANCFNPHSLSEEEKSNLQPKGNDLTFLYFDYRFFEVCVLAWLSKDEVLGDLLEEGDFYKKLYTKLTLNECDTDAKRAFCKDYLFLPIIYGQSAKTLAERANINILVAEKIICRLQNMFAKLFDWVETYKIENDVCVDYIGRKRQLTIGEEYKYRNFIVQSPGAIFCLDKLVSLSNGLGHYGNVVASIHDGYVVRCDDKQTEIVKSICLKILEAESGLFPGLKLKTNHKISKTLS